MSPQEIKTRLEQTYTGSEVEVTDLTGTSDHIQVAISANAFEGQTRIQAHRKIMDLFQKELQSGEIHAFTIKLLKG